MDPITGTIVAAIAAGVTKIATDAPKEIGKLAIKDAYEALKNAIRNKFGDDSKAVKAVSEVEDEHDFKPNQDALAGRLESAGAMSDGTLVKLAEELARALRSTPEGQEAMAKYNIVIQDAQVGVVGDGTHVDGGIHSHRTYHIETLVVAGESQNSPETSALREAYLRRVMSDAGVLSLEGIDPKAKIADAKSLISLDAVYTALWTRSAKEGANVRQDAPGEVRKPVSAIEVIDTYPHVALLGDPGSGKSTLVNYMCLCMAGELLGETSANLENMTRAIPEDEDDEKTPVQSWHHGALIPVRIILRDFAARHVCGCGGSATDLWQFIEEELARATLKTFAEPLQAELREKGGLLLLDGLDEVPEANACRLRIKQAVADFIKTFQRCRVVVTSRTYAYQNQEWRIPGLFETVLAPFSETQIRHFIDRWYAHVASLRNTCLEDAQGRAELLKRVIFASDRLRELAERPLLLTLMASLHAWRGGSLPEKREELYADTVDLLLDWWESPKVIHDSQGEKIAQPSLIEWLKIDRDQMRRFLNRLAFESHAQQLELTGTADVGEAVMVAGLFKLSQNPAVNPIILLDYLNHRAGLLLPRGTDVYTFPHRTIQEYLAACHLTDLDYPEQVAELARKEPNRWREVCLLAGAKAGRGSASGIWSLVDALCYRESGDPAVSIDDHWGALLAGSLLAETVSLCTISERNQPKLNRVIDWLEDILEGDMLPARERALAGQVLGQIGDPRSDVMTVDEMQFCFVPAGPFRMGENPETTALDYDYWIGRYPVTNAQFAEFANDDGYAKQQYWKDGEFKGWRNKEPKSKPEDPGSPFNLPNHPVVKVTWYEAMAFTRWLTERWQRTFGIDLIVRPAHEIEWEKAARGGESVVGAPVIAFVDKMAAIFSRTIEMKENPQPERAYPWGNMATPDDDSLGEWMNHGDTGIGATSAVGCFSQGVSPYGCQELGGNVWEWCRNRYEKDGTTRVLRGGAWYNPAEYCRAAVRFRYRPDYRYRNIGFRLVCLPGQQGEPGRSGQPAE